MALEHLSKTIATHLFLDSIRGAIKQQKSVKLSHFVGSTLPVLINELSKERSLLIVTPDFESAQFFEGDLRELGNNETVLFNPTFRKPYDKAQISDVSSLINRSEQLELILNRPKNVVVTSADALFDFVPSPKSFTDASFVIEKGDSISIDDLIAKIMDLGYDDVNFVGAPGEYSQRGGILDIYPLSTEYPVRLEFFGDEIDSIREFDPDSQRSVSFQDKVRLVPNVEQLSSTNLAPLFNFIPESYSVVLQQEDLIFAELENRLKQAQEAYNQADKEKVSAPEHQFCTSSTLDSWLANKTILFDGKMRNPAQVELEFTLEARPQPDFNASIKVLRQNLEDLSKQGIETTILCDNEAQKERFEELLGEPGATLRYTAALATLHKGFILPTPGIAVYTDHQIFNRYHKPKNKVRQRKAGGLSMKEIRDLNVGDFVVHVDYGIGKFAGFRRIKVKDIEQESVMLKYADDSIMYVNISSLHKLQKYSGKDGAAPQITKLGSGEWQKKKSRTKSRLKDIARDLILLYAKRKSQKAHAFSSDTAWQTELEASFMFEETPDQMKAIIDVKSDMESPTPMDRLVCGDVGFGKTEVAVRAAFKAVNDGKQVAILVPTTILADQHYNTFKKRMANFPIRIEVMNRFKSPKEQKEVAKKTKDGIVDILIGTHRITSKDIAFKDLGLLVVDEEQRFGVSVKERLKEFRATVDVLTLTATPIPRTLHMSLMGARDLSTITTPPPNRQPVLTEIHGYDERIIRDAILAETSRGGQVFFIHNRVQNIGEYAELIRKIVPNVRVQFAHGQMTGTELEHIISDFYEHKFDVLVSTNIVESGIDISNANTIIINRADRFGLSELHQLRGRVGRSNRKAFCYLITPPLQDLSIESRKRLMALEEYSDLGSGFNIAMRDLDIRGAGDVLGAEQSGFINELGYDLYLKILNDAIRELKESEFTDQFEHIVLDEETPDTSVEIDLPALLPVGYVVDNVERLNLYRKLANATHPKEIEEWQQEVIDRFGSFPPAAENLVSVAKIKLLASNMFIDKVTIRGGRMWLQCLNPKTELGKHFFDDGRFQQLVQQLQSSATNRFSLAQKDDIVRFVITDINTLDDAVEFLGAYYKEKATPTFAH
ncbi:transcription-repair coupling factor [bacterium]|nr:MAG: transcription-repair coupling factor [bacterium]